MSYSFSAKGPSVTDAVLDFDAKLDKLVRDMPAHSIDQDAISKHVRNLATLLAAPDYTEEVLITLHGYLSQANVGLNGDKRTMSVCCSVTACLITKR